MVSDAHAGLKAAIARVLQGSRLTTLRGLRRNLLARGLKAHKETVAAAARTIFARSDTAVTQPHVRTVAGTLQARFRSQSPTYSSRPR